MFWFETIQSLTPAQREIFDEIRRQTATARHVAMELGRDHAQTQTILNQLTALGLVRAGYNYHERGAARRVEVAYTVV